MPKTAELPVSSSASPFIAPREPIVAGRSAHEILCGAVATSSHLDAGRERLEAAIAAVDFASNEQEDAR